MQLSILMPVYNGADTLPETLASIQSQDDDDWELVAVDDGSTDGTAALLQAEAARDPRIRLHPIPHGGIVAALNAGLDVCRGDLIMRMDADDIMSPQRVRLQRAFMDQHPDVDLIASRASYGGDVAQYQGLAHFVDWTNQLLSPQQIRQHRFVETPLIHPTVTFRRTLVDQFGGYRDGDFPEDYELWLRWAEAGVVMQKLPDTLLEWRERGGRLTRTDSRYAVDAFYRIKTQYLARELTRRNQARVVVWGAGRITRKRAELLCERGIQIDAYIDIDPKKIGQVIHGRPVWSPDRLKGAGDVFVLVYVGNRGARELIREDLEKRGYVMGKDFMLAA